MIFVGNDLCVVPHGDEYRRPSGASIKYLGVPIVLEQWGGRMPDTAASAAAVNQLPGVPIDKVNGVKYPTF